MEKFIRIESTLLNVNTIADITPNFYNDNQYIVIHTNAGDSYTKQLPKFIDSIDDIASAYIDLIATFLASKEPDELVLDLNAYKSAE